MPRRSANSIHRPSDDLKPRSSRTPVAASGVVRCALLESRAQPNTEPNMSARRIEDTHKPRLGRLLLVIAADSAI